MTDSNTTTTTVSPDDDSGVAGFDAEGEKPAPDSSRDGEAERDEEINLEPYVEELNRVHEQLTDDGLDPIDAAEVIRHYGEATKIECVAQAREDHNRSDTEHT